MFRTTMKKIVEQWFRVKTKEQAIQLKRKFSIFYAILGWNSFGIVFYLLVKKRIPDDPAERRKVYASLTGTPDNMIVYQVTGLSITREFELLKKAHEEAKAEKETKATEKQNTTAKD